MRRYVIARGSDQRDSGQADEVVETTWEEFVTELDPDTPAAEKNCGWYVGGLLRDGVRRKTHIESRSLLALDADKAPGSFIADVAMDLPGVAMVAHTTWSHRKDACRYRVIIPLSRDVSPDDYWLVASAVMNRLGRDWFDGGSSEPERLMLRPSTQNGSYQRAVIDGSPLDVDEWLAEAARLNIEPRGSKRDSQHVEIDLESPPTEEEVRKARTILAKSCREMSALQKEDEFDLGEHLLGRNNAVIKLAPTLLRFVLGGCLDEAEVIEALWEASEEAPSDDPTWNRDEFDGVIENAWGYAKADGPDRPITDSQTWESVFDEHPVLDHIRQSAHAGGGPAAVMLWLVLMRVAMEVPVKCVLPGKKDGSVGRRQVLNFGVLVSADTGGGKSSGFSESRDLVGVDQKWLEKSPKTGAGMEEAFMATVKDEEGNSIRGLKPDPRILFHADELKKLMDNSGGTDSELIGTLCSLLTGEGTGAALQDKKSARDLPENEYRCCMMIGSQTANAGALLNDEDSGAPQRFGWAPGIDPTVPAEPNDWPKDPGPLKLDLEMLMGYDDGEEHVIPVPSDIVYDIRKARGARTRGESDSVTSHLYMMRLKVAACLGVLEGRLEITHRWWRVAGKIMELSLAEQDRCKAAIWEKERLRNQSQGKKQAVVEIAKSEVLSLDVARKKRVKSRMLDKIAAEPGMAKSTLRRAMKAGADRECFDGLLPLLVADGTIREETKMVGTQEQTKLYPGGAE